MSAREGAFPELWAVEPHFTSTSKNPCELEEVDWAPLEKFMRRLLALIDDHPEWRHQASPERMENILQALKHL